MNSGQYIFSQMAKFLSKRQFNRIASKYPDRTEGWSMSHWSHLLVLIFGQLLGCDSLRGLTDITIAHGSKSVFLGFGDRPISRPVLSKANTLRSYRIFEEFAFYMISIAQRKRLTKPFELHGRFFAIDSTTITLCLSVYTWAKYKHDLSGVKIHTQIDIATEIPVFYRITNAIVHDVNSMDWFKYERRACYVFDKGYFDLSRLFEINLIGAFFIIREKGAHKYEIESGEELLEGSDNVLLDQIIRFSRKDTRDKYPAELRRIVYYAPELHRTFTYYTNNFNMEAKNIALLYRYRWQVELFFRWIKQHLRVKTFWGESENAVRIQINVAIITYCLVAIIEHDLKIGKPVNDVLRILGSSLLDKSYMRDLFEPIKKEQPKKADGQLFLNFNDF